MPEEGFTAVTLPKDLVESVKRLLRDYPQLGYTSVAEFVKEALRSKLRVDAAMAAALEHKYGKPLPDRSTMGGPKLVEAYEEAMDLIAPRGLRRKVRPLAERIQEGVRPVRRDAAAVAGRFIDIDAEAELYEKEYEERLRSIIRDEIQRAGVVIAVRPASEPSVPAKKPELAARKRPSRERK